MTSNDTVNIATAQSSYSLRQNIALIEERDNYKEFRKIYRS